MVHGLLQPKVVCDHGEDIYLLDKDGKRYIDFSGDPHVVSIGHNNRKVQETMIKQMEKLSFTFCSFWPNEPLAALAKRIIKVTPSNFTICQLCNSLQFGYGSSKSS